MHHAAVLVVELKVIKNYVLYADVYQSARLLFWRDRDRLLSLLASDSDSTRSDVGAADFAIDAAGDARTHALGLVVGDGDRLRLLEYAPAHAGAVLEVRADFRAGSRALAAARLSADADADATQLCANFVGPAPRPRRCARRETARCCSLRLRRRRHRRRRTGLRDRLPAAPCALGAIGARTRPVPLNPSAEYPISL